MPKIDVKCLTVGAFQENCYLVVNTETRGCLIVDPGAEGERIIRAAQEYKPAAVLLTHAHWDHIGAVDAVCGHFGSALRAGGGRAQAHRQHEERGSTVRLRCDRGHTSPPAPWRGDALFGRHGDPGAAYAGHSAGSVCYLLPQGQGVLTGDTLFAHGYGRTDFADGSFHELKESLRALFHLSPRPGRLSGP